MPDPFLIRALLAGIGVALIAGPMGCFVVWRRMAYFGDSLAHSALLGIALGLLLGINVSIGSIIVCFLFAMLLVWLQQMRVLATDTLLGILAHAALSIGMVTISLLDQRVNLHTYLFGDILTVTLPELGWIYAGGVLVLFVLALNWTSLVLMAIHEDIARAEGIRIVVKQLLFMFLMTLVVAVAIRVVGILLITSMLIIPAATARQFTRSPETMGISAAIMGILAVVLGLSGSMAYDTPSGPSIVVASAGLFVITLPVARFITQKKATDSH
ncbi:MAG: metal ABC transporter permease [Rickettsiales bacterium]|nr:metal ABC transporter permease [Rickettsiales bacterium]